MHGRASTQTKPKSFNFSSFSTDYTKHITVSAASVSAEEVTADDTFVAAVDGLLEKSGRIREKSFLHIAGLLQSYSVSELALESNRITLETAIKRAYRGSVNEKCLAARTAGLYGICMGVDCYSLLESLKPTFEKFIKPTADAVSVSEAICAWAMLAFTSGDSAASEELIGKCMSWLPKAPPAVQTSILNSIALCCSPLPYSTVVNSIIRNYGSQLSDFVRPQLNLQVRYAGAQLMALLFECFRFYKGNDDDYNPHQLDEHIRVHQIISDLENFKGKSKAEQKRGTILFSGYGASIEEGFCTFREAIAIQHTTVTFDTWYSIVQIEWLRDFLQGGLQAHFIENELLHQIFNIDNSRFVTKLVMTKDEKRDYKSKKSFAAKGRAIDRRKNQRKGVSYDEFNATPLRID